MIPRIGTLLSSSLNIDDVRLNQEVRDAQHKGIRLGQQLMHSFGLPEAEVFKALAQQFVLPFMENCEEVINTELFHDLPLELFKDGNCFPVSIDENCIHIVVGDPLDLDIVQQVEFATHLPVRCTLTTPTELKRLHKKYLEDDSLFHQSAGKITREYEQNIQVDEPLSLEEIRERTESEPIVKMATLIFNEAIKLGASDIHIEPSEKHATVRFRIDGLLHQHTELTKWMFSPLTSRIKILADLDISEKRSPQDGRIRYQFEKKQYDFRVSTLPTHFGEKTVIRILKHDIALLDMKNIGLDPVNMNLLADLIEKPQGMLFVTGPTGSGKSSTLFSCLNRISHKAIHITTIENPIEYKIDGVNQVQINEKAGVTFSSALRSILRQDPDVILVGEIRDTETAQISVQAAQTGHLVFSTLHTNDAVSAITRMRDLGIPSFLIASSILAVIAQRLVRVLCPECRKRIEITESFIKRWKNIVGPYPLTEAFSAEGCPKCNGSGFRGRIGIFELVVVSDSLRDMISENASENMIRRTLRDTGFKTLIIDGIDKVQRGITSPEELLRIVQVDSMQ